MKVREGVREGGGGGGESERLSLFLMLKATRRSHSLYKKCHPVNLPKDNLSLVQILLRNKRTTVMCLFSLLAN